MRWAMTPDVNVLVAASRSDHPHHAIARTWLETSLKAAETGAAFTLMPMVIASLLRLVTSPKIFVHPTPVSDAVAFVDAILAMPGVLWVSLGPSGRNCGSSAWRSNWPATTCPMSGWPQRWSTTLSTWSALIAISKSC
jgi:hypothetical protein